MYGRNWKTISTNSNKDKHHLLKESLFVHVLFILFIFCSTSNKNRSIITKILILVLYAVDTIKIMLMKTCRVHLVLFRLNKTFSFNVPVREIWQQIHHHPMFELNVCVETHQVRKSDEAPFFLRFKSKRLFNLTNRFHWMMYYVSIRLLGCSSLARQS